MRTGLPFVTALDFVAFLFNSGQITDQSLKDYFYPLLVSTYQNVLEKVTEGNPEASGVPEGSEEAVRAH